MFEFIGIAVVAWFGFKLINYYLENAVVNMQARAVAYATAQGVPHSFAVATSLDRETVGLAMRALGGIEVGLNKLKNYERYGLAIVYLHAAQLRSEEKQRASALEGIRVRIDAHLAPQIAQLKSEGVPLLVTEVTYAYVAALAGAITKQPIGLDEAHFLVQQAFKNEPVSELIENAYAVVTNTPEDVARKMAALIGVVDRELAEAEGSYYVLYTKLAHRRIAEMYTEGADFDPRKARERTLVEYLGLEAEAGDQGGTRQGGLRNRTPSPDLDDDIPF